MADEKKKLLYEKKLKDFECPFTWNINEAKYLEYKYNNYYNQSTGAQKVFYPINKLMSRIICVYEYVKNKEESNIILSKLQDCDVTMNLLKESGHDEISTEAALFILRATKCFVYYHLEMETELEDMLAQTISIDTSDKKQTSTVKACKSIAWSKYRFDGNLEAIKFIREAIEDNPNCDLWYFTLGKILRRKRRNEQFNLMPDDEEVENFKKAYELKNNLLCKIYLAQVYRERRNFSVSDKMSKEIMQEHDASYVLSDKIYLRLILNFINMKDFTNAKHCLDKVSEESRKRSMYLHYRGLFHMKQQQYREASTFFKEALKDENLAAESNYIFVMQKIDWKFDVTEYLLSILDRYKDWPKSALQQHYLQIGFTYYKKNSNFTQALKYFLEGIEINPESKCLKTFLPVYISKHREKNVYRILQEILLMINKHPNRFDQNTHHLANQIENYCTQYAS